MKRGQHGGVLTPLGLSLRIDNAGLVSSSIFAIFAKTQRMNLKNKQLFQFVGGMMLAAIVAFLLNPCVWMTDFHPGTIFDYVLVGCEYLLVYGIAGAISRKQLWHQPWGNLAFLLFVIINAILAVLLFLFLRWKYEAGDEIMVGFTLLFSAGAAVLSGIPIFLCCYLFKRNTA